MCIECIIFFLSLKKISSPRDKVTYGEEMKSYFPYFYSRYLSRRSCIMSGVSPMH